METLTTGRLAATAGVGIETLRFYERAGLLPAPPRTGAGHRRYPASMAARVRFVKGAQRLGFTLREVTELLDLRDGAGRGCGDLKLAVRAKVRDVDSKIAALKALSSTLRRLAERCARGMAVGDCPIVEHFETGRPRGGERPRARTLTADFRAR